jgi:thiamine-phosphate pyrophosphorylase
VDREEGKILRVLDANANRAREGLRVVEDYCRFVLDDEDLSGDLKRMRHDVTHSIGAIGMTSELLRARDSESDVGANGREELQSDAKQPAQVVVANIKRAEEALRCLEEYSKAFDATCAFFNDTATTEIYTLEKRLLPLLSER